MALHPDFPRSPYEPLSPDLRWFPAAEELRSTAYEKLLPPLVAMVRQEVKAWRDKDYTGASATSRDLLKWWFETDHLVEQADGTQMQFLYYFAQREAVETVIWLFDVRGVRDKFDLLRFDASGAVSSNMFDEDWPRFVVKMATGAGKTKVLSLLMAWSYFHKLYETGSTLARNFLLIASNIIVLDRLRADFDGLKIFFNDPILPDNGHAGRNWRDDFQVVLHIQDDVRVVRPTGNIFLTNIHRVYLGEVPEPSLGDDDLRDYFLSPFGDKPVGKTNESNIDLGEIVREIDELAVFNDEAHHIHDPRLAWFQCIQDIHHRLLQKDLRLAIQVDVTATPRHSNGAIFVQTVSDYPLVEAIAQNVVKHPVLPDAASRAKLAEQTSPIITEKYADYLQLGIEEWRKSYAQLIVLSKAAARDDGAAIVPSKLNAAGATKVGSSLVARKLMREVRSKPGMPVWREDDDGRSISMILTRAGRDAIGVEDDAGGTDAPAAAKRPEVDRHTSTKKAAATTNKQQNMKSAPRPGSKQALVIGMLSKEKGATIDALVAATGWLPHTTRAALTGLRKRGFIIDRARDEKKGSICRIACHPNTAAA